MKHVTALKPVTVSLWLASALSLSALAHANNHSHDHSHNTRQLDAHVHGVAQLLIALEADHLTISLESPSNNIVGFEHPARHDADRALLLAAEEKLTNSQHIFTLAAAAQCQLESVSIESEQLAQLEDAGHDHGHSHGHSEGDGHSEFEVDYHFHCANPAALTGLNIRAFQHFPGFETIDVQWVINGQQGAARTQANRTEVRF